MWMPSCRRTVSRGGTSREIDIARSPSTVPGRTAWASQLLSIWTRDARLAQLATFRQAIELTGRWQAVQEKVFVYATGLRQEGDTAEILRHVSARLTEDGK